MWKYYPLIAYFLFRLYIVLCVIHNIICLQIYLNLSQPIDLIKADIATIEAKYSLYNIRIARY